MPHHQEARYSAELKKTIATDALLLDSANRRKK